MSAPVISGSLTANEIVEEWGISRSTLSKWANDGIITRHRGKRCWLYNRREISAAYYSTNKRHPSIDTLIEEAEFFLGYGKTIDSVVARLAEAYSMDFVTIRVHLQETYPELRKPVGRPAT